LLCAPNIGLVQGRATHRNYWMVHYTTAQIRGVIGAYNGGIDGLLCSGDAVASSALGTVERLVGELN